MRTALDTNVVLAPTEMRAARPSHLPLALATGLAATLLGFATEAPARSPTDWGARVSTLRAKLDGSPGDTRARCELGWGLVQLARWADARAELDRAISELGAPAAPAMVKRLAACLYNRGRAAEGAGEGAAARADYERSLTLRPNDTVAAALRALVGDAAAGFDETKVLAAVRERCEALQPGRDLLEPGERIRCKAARDAIRRVPSGVDCEVGRAWAVVTTRKALPDDPTGEDLRFAVLVEAGLAAVELLRSDPAPSDEWNSPSYDVDASVETVAPNRCGLVVKVEATQPYQGESCEDDAIPGSCAHYLARSHALDAFVVTRTASGLSALEFPLAREDCEQDQRGEDHWCRDGFELDLALDGRGYARVTKLSGKVPKEYRYLIRKHALPRTHPVPR